MKVKTSLYEASSCVSFWADFSYPVMAEKSIKRFVSFAEIEK